MRYICNKCHAENQSDSPGDRDVCSSCGASQKVPESILSPGAIFDEYVIESYLGSGRLGDVYQAYDQVLDRKIAIKVLSNRFENDSDIIFSFMGEAKKSAGLLHPNIIQVYGCGEYASYYYFAMELVVGESLRTKLESKPETLTVNFAVEMLYQVVEALDYIWTETNEVHGSLQPDNILIGDKKPIKLCEVGSAGYSEGGASGLIFSPEFLRGEKLDHRSDIFCAGMLFYTVLNRANPFAQLNAKDYREAILTNPLPELADDEDAGALVNNLILRMTSISRSKRYRTYKRLLEDIDYLRRELKSGASCTLLKEEEKARSAVSSILVIFSIVAVVFVVIMLVFPPEEEKPVEVLSPEQAELSAWSNFEQNMSLPAPHSIEEVEALDSRLRSVRSNFKQKAVLDNISSWQSQIDEALLRQARQPRWQAYQLELTKYRESIHRENLETAAEIKEAHDKEAAEARLKADEDEVAEARERFFRKNYDVLRLQIWKTLEEGSFERAHTSLKKFKESAPEEYLDWCDIMVSLVSQLEAYIESQSVDEEFEYESVSFMQHLDDRRRDQDALKSSLFAELYLSSLIINRRYNEAAKYIRYIKDSRAKFFMKELAYLNESKK